MISSSWPSTPPSLPQAKSNTTAFQMKKKEIKEEL